LQPQLSGARHRSARPAAAAAENASRLIEANVSASSSPRPASRGLMRTSDACDANPNSTTLRATIVNAKR
jgi:hypothetical protein